MKRTQIFVAAVCYGYLVRVIATGSSDSDSTKLDNFRQEINGVVQKTNKIVLNCRESGMQEVLIKEDTAEQVREVVKYTLTLADSETNVENSDTFKSNVDTLKTLEKLFNENYKKKGAYKNFIEKWSKELLEVKKEQRNLWPKISQCIKKAIHDITQSKSYNPNEVAFQSQKDKDDCARYKEFITNLKDFVKIAIDFETVSRKDEFLKKYTENILSSKKSSDEKIAECTNLSVFFLLKSTIAYISSVIDSSTYDILKKIGVNSIQTNNNPGYLFIFGLFIEKYEILETVTEMEKKEYDTNKNFTSVSPIFDSLGKYMSKKTSSYAVLKDILEENIKEYRRNMEDKYRSLVQYLRKEEHARHNWIQIVYDVEKKIDQLLRYNDSIVDEVYRIINSDASSGDKTSIENSSFILTNANNFELDMTDPKLHKKSFIEWFDIRDTVSRKKLHTDKISTPFFTTALQENPMSIDEFFGNIGYTQWGLYMKKDLDANRKSILEKLENVLMNIDKMFLVLSQVLTGTLYDSSYINAEETIKNIRQEFFEFCYAAKLRKFKNIEKCQTPPYILSTVRLLESIEQNAYSQYSALSLKRYSKLQKITRVEFVLNENKTCIVLRYLQSLIRQCNDSFKKLTLLPIDTQIVEKQDELVNKLCEMHAHELKPRKALKLTLNMIRNIEVVLDRLVYDVRNTTKIKTIKDVYTMQKSISMFETALETLELIVPKDELAKIAEFTAYKQKNIQKIVKKMLKEGRKKETRESHKAFLSSIKNILDIEDAIVHVLLEIHKAHFNILYQRVKEILPDDSDFTSQSDSQDTSDSKEEPVKQPQQPPAKQPSVKQPQQQTLKSVQQNLQKLDDKKQQQMGYHNYEENHQVNHQKHHEQKENGFSFQLNHEEHRHQKEETLSIQLNQEKSAQENQQQQKAKSSSNSKYVTVIVITVLVVIACFRLYFFVKNRK